VLHLIFLGLMVHFRLLGCQGRPADCVAIRVQLDATDRIWIREMFSSALLSIKGINGPGETTDSSPPLQ
jgi:hypothetical protein